jgi:hypothetical protein
MLVSQEGASIYHQAHTNLRESPEGNDVEVERTRKREAQEHGALTTARVFQDKQHKERRVAEDVRLTKHERELYGEGVRFC